MTERRRCSITVHDQAGDRPSGTRAGEQIHNADGFQQFWEDYPRKVGRLAAIREWNRIKPDEALVNQILATVNWQRETRSWVEGYIPHPRTYLHQGRWLDEPDAPLAPVVPAAPQGSKRVAGLMAGAQAFLNRNRG